MFLVSLSLAFIEYIWNIQRERSDAELVSTFPLCMLFDVG